MTHLTPGHTQQLVSSAIKDAVIESRGYQSIAPGAAQAVRELTGGAFSPALLKQILHQGALAIPLYRLGNDKPHTWVLRPDLPRSNEAGKPVKYEYPRGVSNVFDVLPAYASALADPMIPLWLTEGAKKADALASAYGDRIVPINLNGVYGWRGRSEKGGKVASPDMELIAWEGRHVVIAPDGDVKDNINVLHAVQRLGRLLAAKYGVASLQVLYLPQQRGAPKLGIDDYLAQQHTTGEIEAHMVDLAAVANGARVPFGVHADTGEQLMLPAGYDVRDKTLMQVDEQGKARRLYSGGIYVAETGMNLQSGEQSAVVAWNGRGNFHGEQTIPYTALSDSKTFSATIGAAGAALGPKNIKDVMQYLVEFVQENRDVLPHRAHADRLGTVGAGLVLPAGAVGFSEPVRYVGRPTVAVGTVPDAYGVALRELAGCPDSARWPLWLLLGLSLSAPMIGRLNLRRNPVVYISGESGSGKTTAAQFATGCWGEPTRHPLRIESGRTTPAGIFQTLEGLGGLPTLIDEAHTVPDPKRLELACYGFANGQQYTKGGVDGKARGGDILNGALFLAGEALPEFKHAGSRLRVLWIDASAHPPLGAPARSPEGQQRAAILEAAWNSGAGLFGHAVASDIWANWPDYVAAMRVAEADHALARLGPWRAPLAAAIAALDVALKLADVRVMPGVEQMLDHWADMLLEGQQDTDPAADAWEALVTMLAQGQRGDDSSFDNTTQYSASAQWDVIEADRGGGVIACRKVGEAYWRVLANTPQFKERIGANAVQLYGQSWLKRGWLQPGKDGKSTSPERIFNGSLVRVLRIPDDVLHNRE